MSEFRVLQILPELNQGGVERGTIDIAKAILENGNIGFVASNGGKLVEELDVIGVKHFKLPIHSKNLITMIRNVFRLKKIIEDNDINIIHARSRAPAWSGYFACLITGCNFVTTFHGAYNAEFNLKRLYNSVMLKGKRVIAISNFILKHIETRYRCNLDRIKVIHRGVDLSYFHSKDISEKRINFIKDFLKVELKGTVILMPGRITRIKGHLYMLEALKYIKDKDFTFLIVGSVSDKHFEYKKEIERTIISYGLKDKISIHPAVTDMPALYSISDIVVCPTITAEAFGRTIAEAQAMGKIVVATRIGAPVETIEDGVTGYLVSPKDPSEMADILKKILKLKQTEKDAISKKAKLKVEQEFSLSKMCDETLKLYQEVVDTSV